MPNMEEDQGIAIEKTICERARYDGTYAVAYSLIQVAAALNLL